VYIGSAVRWLNMTVSWFAVTLVTIELTVFRSVLLDLLSPLFFGDP
jgi:hypothetical protein